jgi:hypothetical protein
MTSNRCWDAGGGLLKIKVPGGVCAVAVLVIWLKVVLDTTLLQGRRDRRGAVVVRLVLVVDVLLEGDGIAKSDVLPEKGRRDVLVYKVGDLVDVRSRGF